MSDITSGQKLEQKARTEAIKWFFWPQNLAGPKNPWEHSVQIIFWCFRVPWVRIWSPLGAEKIPSGTSKHLGFGCPLLYTNRVAYIDPESPLLPKLNVMQCTEFTMQVYVFYSTPSGSWCTSSRGERLPDICDGDDGTTRPDGMRGGS